MKKRVAIIQTTFTPGGGTEAVSAWMMEALKADYEISLITFTPVEVEALNGFYQTNLRADQISVIRPALPRLLARTRHFNLLKAHLMMRFCRSIKLDFDLFISCGREMFFGRPGIQYLALAPGSGLQYDGYRARQLLRRVYQRICYWISGSSNTDHMQNMTLVVSEWAGRLIESIYQMHDYRVVYPPISPSFDKSPWASRKNGFLCVGRLVPEKQIDKAIEILKEVRDNGFDINLHIDGRPDDPVYAKKINQICETEPWITMSGLMPKDDLLRLMGDYKYGINAATDEPFGIVVAEMVQAGSIVFVPNSGGQTEIVTAPELTYDDVPDAVKKITRVLGEPHLQESVLDQFSHDNESFSTESFCQNIRGIVCDFLKPPGENRAAALPH